MGTEKDNKLALFEGRQIRKAFHEGEWWFSIIDVVEVLVGGDRPRKYWNDLKKKLTAEGYSEVSEKIGQWKDRGARTTSEYAILTNEIMQGSFGLKVEEYKQVKDLERENLRDHMTDIELILTMLAEATTTELHRDRDSQGMAPLKKDAQDGGAVAGRTRKDIEAQTGKPVITGANFKQLSSRKPKKLKADED